MYDVRSNNDYFLDFEINYDFPTAVGDSMACRCGRSTACVRKLTFTAWINQCLQDTGMKVQDLERDLADGLVLLKLLEILSPKSRMPGRLAFRVTFTVSIR